MTDKRKSFDWILLAIIALAAVLRIFRIASESLWFDESAVLVRIESSYWGLFTDWHSHRQGWLHPFLLKLWFGVFGSSETALRLPSSIFGVLCVWAIYVTGKKMFGRTAGLAAALFMAVSPFAIQHSQEARPYTLYLLGGILSIYSLVLLLERYSRGRAAFYVISTLVALFSHPLAILLFPAHVAGYFVFRQYPEYPAIRQNTRLLIRTLLLTVILSLPQTGRSLILFVLKARGGDISRWIPEATTSTLAQTVTHYFMYPPLGIAAVGILGLALLLYARSDRAARPMLLFLLAVVVFCLLLPWLASLIITPMFVHRYTIPAFAAVLLALGWALMKVPRLLRVMTIAGLIILTSIPLYSYYENVDRDPFRQMAEFVHAEFLPDDVVVAHPWWLKRIVAYYLDEYPEMKVYAPAGGDSVGDWAEIAGRIWVISSYKKVGAREDGVVDAVSEGRRIETDFDMADRVNLNPWRVHAAKVRVVRFGIRGPAASPGMEAVELVK